MKKALFATTALVAAALAGSASAQDIGTGISISISAELGVGFRTTNTGAAGAQDVDVSSFINDFKVDFAGSGTTDGGLTFGAAGEVDSNGEDPDTNTLAVAGANVDVLVPGATTNGIGDGVDGQAALDDLTAFLSGAFGTLTLGDTDGAIDRAIQGISTAGVDDEADFYAFDAIADGIFDGQILRYDYSFADFTVSFSAELDDTPGPNSGEPVYQIAAAYDGSFGDFDFGLGLGYGFSDKINTGGATDTEFEAYAASLEFGVAGFDIIANYQYSETSPTGAVSTEVEAIGVSATYDFNNIELGANYFQVETETGSTTVQAASYDAFGVWATYDFGGGLEATAAFGSQEFDSGAEEQRYGFGFSMSF